MKPKTEQHISSTHSARLTALFEVAKTMSAVLDLDSLLMMVVRLAAEQCYARKCTLMLLDKDTKELVIKNAVGVDESVFLGLRVKLGKGIAGQVAETGQPILVRDIEKDPRFHRKSKKKYQTKSFLSVPLLVKNDVIGVLNVNDRIDNHSFSQEDFELLSILASQVAVAIDNAKLYTETNRMRDYLQNILNNLIESVVVIDGTGRCTFVNEKSRIFFKPTINFPVGMKYTEIFNPRIAKTMENVIAHTYQFGIVIDQEVEINDDKGNKIPIGITGSLLQIGEEHEQKTKPGIILISRDLTPSQELAKLRVMNEMKTEFVSTVSHELRTPLTAIKGSVGLMAEGRTGVMTPMQQEMITLVRRNTDRLARMIDDLLELTRAESGRMRIDQQHHDFKDIVKEVLDLFKQQAEIQKLTLLPIIQPKLSPLFIDRDKITQVLINLVGNALKFTPEDGTITIQASETNEFWQVMVQDTGIGIPEEELSKIFDAYHQVRHPQRETVFKGFGLGLPITKRIIDAHGGKIWVKSQIGKGSSFTFRIPKNIAKSKKETVSNPSTSPNTVPIK
jgi:signal transduction histidine kinase/putative methionine-R-sulfoxide reductase with GAF domain